MHDVLVYSIDSCGSLQGLYSDKLNLSRLGKQRIERATDIAHNHETQCWDVYILPERETVDAATRFTSYERARQFEVDWLNQCRRQGVHPLSVDGRSIATVVRGANRHE